MVWICLLVLKCRFKMSFSPSFDALVDALQCLSGVGKKTGQRMALDLLLKKQEQAQKLAHSIANALLNVKRCQCCRNLSDEELCLICANPKRDKTLICVVEQPSDVLAFEQSTDHKGIYFVLMGHIAPLDGIGPQALGMDILDERLKTGEIQELILATSTTLEGEGTAYFLAELGKKYGVKVTRLAHGVPLGGELTYLDDKTLSLAFNTRQEYQLDNH